MFRFTGSPFSILSWWLFFSLVWFQWYWCEHWEMIMQNMLVMMMIWSHWWAYEFCCLFCYTWIVQEN
jgi:hypothetical protein